MARARIDRLLVDRGLVESREQAARHIMAGEVLVGGKRVDKAGALVAPDAAVELQGRAPYVSRGGEKLIHALETFQVKVAGRVCLDVGASTGGFTDCLLQRGAKRVYAVDVGHGQLDARLRARLKTGGFIWPAEVQAGFPSGEFWFLYGQLR